MKHDLIKRVLAVALSLAVGMTFIPLLGDSAFAEDNEPAVTEVNEEDAAADAVSAPDTEVLTEESEEVAGEGGEGVDADIPDADANDTEENAAADAADTSDVRSIDVDSVLPKIASGAALKDVRTKADADLFTWSVSVSGKKATVKGSIKPEYKDVLMFGGLFMDGQEAGNKAADIASDSFSTTINMSNYTIGYHTLYALFIFTTNGSNVYTALMNEDYANLAMDWRAKKKVASKIIIKPNYNGKFYYVYSKYFDYFPFNFGKNLNGTLYMEYKLKGAKKWKRTGAMKANAIKLYTSQGFKIKGLKANRTYYTRIRYGQYVTYSKDIGGDGKSYFFGGPTRKTTTIKTGQPKKPAIKSIKVKAVKVKKHKVRHYGYYTGVYLYTEKYYTYKVKVTIKLKKKPGASGLWVNGKFVKGNKKKYTVTLPGSSYSKKKPKGKKYKLNISSYKSKSYGGLSPLYKTTKKIK